MRTDPNLPIWRALDDIAAQESLVPPDATRERMELALDALAHVADGESLLVAANLVALSLVIQGAQATPLPEALALAVNRGFQLGVRAQQIADDLARTGA